MDVAAKNCDPNVMVLGQRLKTKQKILSLLCMPARSIMVVQIVKESTWPSKRLKNFPATLKRLLRKRIGPITGDFNKFFEPDETRVCYRDL